jgi:hypothetical protein
VKMSFEQRRAATIFVYFLIFTFFTAVVRDDKEGLSGR